MKKIFNKIIEKIKLIFNKIKEIKKERELRKDLKIIFKTQMEIAAHWMQVRHRLVRSEDIDIQKLEECNAMINQATSMAVSIYIKLHNLERNFEES